MTQLSLTSSKGRMSHYRDPVHKIADYGEDNDLVLQRQNQRSHSGLLEEGPLPPLLPHHQREQSRKEWELSVPWPSHLGEPLLGSKVSHQHEDLLEAPLSAVATIPAWPRRVMKKVPKRSSAQACSSETPSTPSAAGGEQGAPWGASPAHTLLVGGFQLPPGAKQDREHRCTRSQPLHLFPPAWWHCTLRRENMSFHKPFTLRTTSPTPPSSVHPFHLFIQNTKMTVFIYNVYLFHSVLSLLCIFVHGLPSRLLSLLLPLLLVVCPLLFTKSTLRHWKNSSTCSYCPGYCSPYFACIWILRSQRLIEGKQKKWKQTSAPPGLSPPAPYIMLLIFPSHKSFNGRKKRR